VAVIGNLDKENDNKLEMDTKWWSVLGVMKSRIQKTLHNDILSSVISLNIMN
jgi:hypothetical protein